MQFSVEDIGALKRRISVEIPPDAVASEIDAAYGKLKNQVKMDGFRKGKVPRPLLERHYKDRVEYEVASKLVHDSLSKVMSENEIMPVSEPEVQVQPIITGNALRYTATVEIKPEIEIKGYEGIRVEKGNILVTDIMVDDRVEELRKRHVTLKDVERPLNDGDTGLIDFEGSMDGVPFQGGKGQDMLLKIGSGRFIPGFEEQLIGMSIGEEREINVKFPGDYGNKELAGKDAAFKVKLKGVKEEALPAIDDDFAKDLGFQTLDELKGDVRKGIEEEERLKARGKMKEKILDTLLEQNPFDVPPSMVKKQRDYLLEDLKRRYERAGLKFSEDMEDPAIIENLGKTALKQVKAALVLMAIAKKEGMGVSDKEVDERLKSIAAKNRMDSGMLRNYYVKNNLLGSLRSEMLEEKVFDHIIGRAEAGLVGA